MSRLYELRTNIREFIHHARRLDALLTDLPNWNQLASAFDTIADTEMAITAYKQLVLQREDKGVLYLVIYGVLQALYVQQDAVEALVRGFSPNQTPRYRIENEPEAAEIRAVRHRAVGHPTMQGGTNSKKKPGVQTSHHISQFSMSQRGFEMMTSYADGSHTFEDIDLFELVEKNARMLERVLERVQTTLRAAEMEHRMRFRDEKLVNLFPATLDYHFEKVFEGARKLNTGHGEWGKISLEMVADAVEKFRAALADRGLLTRSSNYDYYLDEVEYPLAELTAYFGHQGSLKDERAADIFAFFLKAKVDGLVAIAQQVDAEYAEDLEASEGAR